MGFEHAKPTEVDFKRPVITKSPSVPKGWSDSLKPDIMHERSEERRAEVFEALNVLEHPSDDVDEKRWEQREALIRLINFIAEYEYPNNASSQAARSIELMERIPSRAPIGKATLTSIANLARTILNNPFAFSSDNRDTHADDLRW